MGGEGRRKSWGRRREKNESDLIAEKIGFLIKCNSKKFTPKSLNLKDMLVGVQRGAQEVKISEGTQWFSISKQLGLKLIIKGITKLNFNKIDELKQFRVFSVKPGR